MSTFSGSFAESQLVKFGWTKGSGLGKNRDGITKTISVAKKTDTKGVGSGQDQWEFAWWDHLYNKSAASVKVDKAEDGIKVVSKAKSEVPRSRTGIISTVRPSGKSMKGEMERKKEEEEGEEEGGKEEEKMDAKAITAAMARKAASALLYGSFVRSTTGVLNNDESKSPTPTLSTTPTSQEDDDLKDYSQKVSDIELFAACEGRTARKGARSDQTGKFARVMGEYLKVQRQEAEEAEERKERKRKRKEKDEVVVEEAEEKKKVKKAEKKAKKVKKKKEREMKRKEKKKERTEEANDIKEVEQEEEKKAKRKRKQGQKIVTRERRETELKDEVEKKLKTAKKVKLTEDTKDKTKIKKIKKKKV
ncbi:hypothetical protein BC936DRAFT_142757 [Jimgerdemannia flammicorona]|uniref:G-patch domain-containing protein n=1 Tax=Jimgerdemannia flammicorona TaxID=994334 RepID=A0A433DES2_9FUNG|nr:hypothetical protein BC936DRAFT_142757 [Jimgerdemannia flammicorona]